jgi:hydroxymethylbilane synthase
MTTPQKVIIGTRGSKLALWQANWVKEALYGSHPRLTIEILIIKTKGDKIIDVPLAKVGGKGLFVKEIEEALLDGRIDIAVHSMKDMPARLPDGLIIGAVPLRESPLDVLITRGGERLSILKSGATVGTSSLRRAAQLRHIRPDLKITPLRGNLDTRLKKLADGKMDAIVLAAAGIKRLGLADRISEYLNEETMLPAVGQGALSIEIRTDDPNIGPLVASLNHDPSRTVVMSERAFLQRLEGGCQIPIAAHAKVEADTLTLTGLVADSMGSRFLKQSLAGPASHGERIGIQLAENLLAQGAGEILARIKSDAQ